MPDYAATNTKKFLDAAGLAHFAQKLNNYPTNDVIEAVVEGVQESLDEKIDISEKNQANGVAPLDSGSKVPLTNLPAMVGATNSTNGSAGLVPAPTSQDTTKFLRGDGVWGEGGLPMVVLSYGNSTWNDFLDAYNNNVIVYCKASSNANPAAGDQKRMAFMAYVDRANVEFQYYRSMSSHTDSQQGDQTYVYKLTSGNVWSVTVRENYTKVVAGTGISSRWANGQITLSADNNGTITGITMNGASKGTSGVVDLGTVITEHQDISGKMNANLKGAANGVAELDENGKVPTVQLPSYVDDVVEYNTRNDFPSTGEAGKIYVNLADNLTYRWSGSTYIEISPSLALGSTSSTAFRGDYGQAAYAHGVTNKGSAFQSGLYKITTNSEGHVTDATAVLKQDITDLGIPGENTTYSFDETYNASTNKAATVLTVTNAIGMLNGGEIGTPGAGKTITSLSQSGGNVSASFSDISITKTQVSDLGPVGTAASKDFDTSIAAASTSTNLPTSKAVADFVEGKGYKTTDSNTTYTLLQSSIDGHVLTLTGSDGSTSTITVPDNDSIPSLNDLGISEVKNYDQSKAINSIVRSGTTFTYTCLDGTTGTFTQQDDDTWIAFVGASATAAGTAGYVPAPGKGNQGKFFRGDGLWAVPENTNTTYSISQDSEDGHKFTLTGSDGSTTTITIPDNNTTYTLSSLGIGNVKNYDQSKAIKSITRSGTTFTYTCLDNTTGTFTQQDNDTWIAMVGATSSANGTAGYVPAPPKDGYNTKYLRADGSWSIPPDNNTDTKVTSVGNHYTPATDANAALTASASGATAAWSIDVVKGVTLNRDAKGHVTGVSVTSGKIPGNPNTDTKVTSAANHYTPATATGSDVTASAADGTPAWSEDFVKGVTLNTDGKGHVTGMTVTSGKLPANPNTDTKNTAGSKNTSSKIFLIGATSQATNPVTYSHDTAYVGTDGCLYSGGSKVLTEHQDISGKANLASPALTGTPTAPTAAAGTNNTQIATTAFVTSAVAASFAANDAMLFKGTIGTSGSGATLTALPTTHNQGWTYKVITAGTYASKPCEVGDMIICIADGTKASDDDWTVVQSNIDGAVVGPASAVADRVATFSNTSGKVIKDSGFTIGKSVPSDAVFTDVSVTSANTHYAPVRNTNADKSASASGASAAWSIDVVKGVTLQTDGKGHVTGIAVTSGKIPANPNTDTKVTSAANHYSPVADTDSKLTANATGASAAWGFDVVKGVALERDAKGHVVALTVTSGKLPSLGTSSTTAAKGNHTHTTSIATSSGTSQITLSASTKYILTAGGTSYIFTTPPNTTYTAITDAEIDSIWST